MGVLIKRREMCQKCIGDGTCHSICKGCNGRGEINFLPCYVCQGDGYFDGKCPICNGEGVAGWGTSFIAFTVPVGSKAGTALTLVGEGEHAPHKRPGDVRVILIEKND